MLNCNQAEKLIQMAVDGHLALGDREQLDRHVAVCSQCERVWEQYRSLARIAREWAAPASEQESTDAVYVAQIMERVGKDPGRGRSWWTLGIVAGACTMLTIVSVFLSPRIPVPSMSTVGGDWLWLRWGSLLSDLLALPGAVLRDLVGTGFQLSKGLESARTVAAPMVCMELLGVAILLNLFIYIYTTKTSSERLAR